MNMKKYDDQVVREAGFLFEFATIARLNLDRTNEFISIVMDKLIIDLHNNILYKNNINLYDKDEIKSIINHVQDVLNLINSIEIYPFRFMIEDCCLVTCKDQCGKIRTTDKEFKKKIEDAQMIKQLFTAIQKQNKERFKRALINAEFLVFKLVVFTKFAPVDVINGATGESLIDDSFYDDGYDDDDEDDK